MKVESLVERCTLALLSGSEATLTLDLNRRASGAKWMRLVPRVRSSPRGRVLASKGEVSAVRFKAQEILDFLIDRGLVQVIETTNHDLVEKANELRYGTPEPEKKEETE